MIQSVERTFGILETIALGGEKGLGLVEIARAMGLEKSTTYNLVKTLLALGYLAQDGNGGKYRIGSKLLELTNGGVADQYLSEIALPLCEELQKAVGENIMLAAYRAGTLKSICRVTCDNELVVAPNNFKPLYTTVTGRCLLAGLAEDQLSNIVNIMGLPGESWDSITDMNGLNDALSKIRMEDKYVMRSEKRQLGGVGFVIQAPHKYTPLAIGTAMPLFRFKKKEKLINAKFAEYAKKLSTLLLEFKL